MIKRVRAIILDQDGLVLLGRAPSGMLGLVGGHVEEGEDELDALLREVSEECGYRLSHLDFVHPLFKQVDQQIYLIKVHSPFLPDCSKDPDCEFSDFVWAQPHQLPEPMWEDAEEVLYKYARSLDSAAPEIVCAGILELEQGSKIIIKDDGASGYKLRAVINRATKSLRITDLTGSVDDVNNALKNLKSLADQYLISTMLIEAETEFIPLLMNLGFKKASGASPNTYKLPLRAIADVFVKVDGKEYKFDDDEIWLTLPRLAQERFKGNSLEIYQKLPSGEIINFNADPTPWGSSPKLPLN